MQNLSAKERKARKFYAKLGVIVVALVIFLSLMFYLDRDLTSSTNSNYSTDELVHDHDVDGIPDHGADAH